MLSYVSKGEHFCPKCAAILRESGFMLQPAVPGAGTRCASCRVLIKPATPTRWSVTVGPLLCGMTYATIFASGAHPRRATPA